MACPKCNNIMGFVFGTCIECGWNYLSNQWEYIKVRVDDLPEEIQDYFIQKHAKRYDDK